MAAANSRIGKSRADQYSIYFLFAIGLWLRLKILCSAFVHFLYFSSTFG